MPVLARFGPWLEPILPFLRVPALKTVYLPAMQNPEDAVYQIPNNVENLVAHNVSAARLDGLLCFNKLRRLNFQVRSSEYVDAHGFAERLGLHVGRTLEVLDLRDWMFGCVRSIRDFRMFPTLKLLLVDDFLLVQSVRDRPVFDYDGAVRDKVERQWARRTPRLLDFLPRSTEEVDLALSMYANDCEYILPKMFDRMQSPLVKKERCPNLSCVRVVGIPRISTPLKPDLRKLCAKTGVEFTSWEDLNFGRPYDPEFEGLVATWGKNVRD